MSEHGVIEQIRQLVTIQGIDAQIYECETELTDKPARLQELKQEFEDKQKGLRALEERYKAVQVQRSSLEKEVQGKDDAIAKSNKQLSDIKTNKEYSAKITEIENIKADRSILEDKILNLYEDSDQIKLQIDKEKEGVATEEKAYLASKKEVEDAVLALEEKVKGLQAERQRLAADFDPKILARYERILKSRPATAVVPVRGSSCGGCYMNVPAQVQNEIKRQVELIQCENCSRILYLEEDM